MRAFSLLQLLAIAAAVALRSMRTLRAAEADGVLAAEADGALAAEADGALAAAADSEAAPAADSDAAPAADNDAAPAADADSSLAAAANYLLICHLPGGNIDNELSLSTSSRWVQPFQPSKWIVLTKGDLGSRQKRQFAFYFCYDVSGDPTWGTMAPASLAALTPSKDEEAKIKSKTKRLVMAWTETQTLKPAMGAMVIQNASVIQSASLFGKSDELIVTGFKCDDDSRRLLKNTGVLGITMRTESSVSDVRLTDFNAFDVTYTEVVPAERGAALEPASPKALKNWIDKQLSGGLSPALPPRTPATTTMIKKIRLQAGQPGNM